MGASGAPLSDVSRVVRFGLYEFHPDTLQLKRSGQQVRLQELPARLLAALLRAPGALVTRDQLQSELWPSDTYVQFDAGLNTAMNKLRLALRDSAENPQFIRTVPRSGYQFIGPVAVPGPSPVKTLQPLEKQPSAEVLPAPSMPRRAKWPWVALPAAALAIVGAVVAVVVHKGRPAGFGPTVKFAIDLPPGQTFDYYSGRQIAISRDGTKLVWIAASGRVRQIYARNLSENSYWPLAQTAGATSVAFSSAGDWVAYIGAGELRKVSIDGRSNRKVLTLEPRSNDGTIVWADDGWIYFCATSYPASATGDFRGVYRVRPEGGKPEPLLGEPQPAGIWYPMQLLGDGLLTATGYAPSDRALNYIAFSDRKARQLLTNAANGRYIPSGHLLFSRSGALWAAPFDKERMEITGTPVAMVSDIAPDRYAGLQMDVSDTGALAYFRGSLVHIRQPVWVDHSGRETPSGLPAGRYHLLDLSPDGDHLLLTRYESGDNWKICSFGLKDGAEKEIHSDDSPGSGAIWAPDGRSVAIAAHYQSERMDTLYVKPLDGSATPRPLQGDAYNGKYPQSWSGAANAILFTEGYHDKTKRDIYALSLAPGAQPQCIACTAEDDVFSSFSPDGRWISYTSASTGRFEIYVQRYPGPAQPIRITSEGGQNSLWAPSGREIY
jgi:serine/threonine-protein kinase